MSNLENRKSYENWTLLWEFSWEFEDISQSAFT